MALKGNMLVLPNATNTFRHCDVATYAVSYAVDYALDLAST